MPTYEPPIHPLNEAAQRALQNLRNTHSLNSVKTLLAAADKKLSEAAAEINDRSYHRVEKERKRKARRMQQGVEEGEGERRRAEEAREFEERADAQTGKIEEGVRGLIDAQARVEAVEAALGEVHGNVVAGGGLIAPTQSTLGASQFRQAKRRRMTRVDGDDSEDDESEDEEGCDGENIGVMVALKQKMEEHEGRYQKLSLRTRYANHNSYVHFKKLVHDATHPGEDTPPLPHPSTWFPSDPRDAPNASASQSSRNQTSTQNNEDDESDLEVTSERISIKCPITLRPMNEPVSTTKCPHSFEKKAILEMMERSTMTVDGSRWRRGLEKALKCPVCGVTLTPSTIREDPILIRKIKRLQAAQAQDPEDDFGSSPSDNNRTPGGTQRNAYEEVGVGSEDDTQSTIGKRAVRVKIEKATQSQVGGRRVTGGLEEEGEGEEEEEEGEEYEEDEEEEARRPASSGGMIVDLGEGSGDDEEGEETGEEDG
ncbi:hypothetical protein MMC30_002597 [Trapelia coarctata]|nr:hypothetical protein [Trapelia coarctata]